MVVFEMNCKVCGNTSVKNTSVSFFRFPKENSKCRDWADRCDLLGLFEKHGPVKFHKSFRICSQHFDPKDVVFDGRKNRLLDSAIPHLSATPKNPSTQDNVNNFNFQLPQNLCRLRAEEDDNVTDIFDWRGKLLNLESKLKYFPQVINKHDILPLKTCNQCVSKVNQFYHFIFNCPRPEIKLRAMVDTKLCDSSPQLTHSDQKPDWGSAKGTTSNQTPKLIRCLTSVPDNMTANSYHHPVMPSFTGDDTAPHINLITADFPKNFTSDHDYSNAMSGDQLLPQTSMEDAKFSCHVTQDCKALSAHSLPTGCFNELCHGVFCSRFPLDVASQPEEGKCLRTACDKNLDEVAFLDNHSFAHRLSKDLRFDGEFSGDWTPTSFRERLGRENDVSVDPHRPGAEWSIHSGIWCRACQSRRESMTKARVKGFHGVEQSCRCRERFSKKRVRPPHDGTHSEESHQCTECGKFFRSKASLRQHGSVHSEKRLHHCRECGMSFKRKDTLCNHLRIHTGERPFMCKVCGFAFKQRGDCMKHENNHGKDGDRETKRELWGERVKAVESETGIQG